jgi:receptor protein-tyrosine kinase
MSDNSRLNLIQRAADRLKKADPADQRLAPVGAGADDEPQHARQPSIVERAAAAAAQKTSGISPISELSLRPADPQPPRFDPIQRSGTEQSPKVRLRFADLRNAGMVTPDNMVSEISNEFRRVKRDLLLRARETQSLRLVNNLVMITSSLPGEGKTFVSTNLALSLAAERDLHVLLIDGDPVRQSLGRFFEGPVDAGLIDVLAGDRTDLGDVIFRCEELPSLSVIFAGNLRPNAPELMASKRMIDVCVELSTRYPDRMIIIDTPPVLGSAEPAAISLHVHQLIMVVASGQTSRVAVRNAIERVSSCRNIALLLNKAPHWYRVTGGSYYYYYQHKTGGGL